MLGSTVSHYRIEELIGEGGMGVVYRAHDLTLNRAVAVKFLSLMAADGDRRRRFQFEAEAASSLNHPHILSVFEVGTHDGKPYLVTEFVHGSTLREWVRQVSPSVRQLLEALVPVAEALATAHQAGLVHRDIKPENVLVAKAGYAKLADFGLAKVVDTASAASTATVTVPGVVLGTVAYMSPEQAAGAPVDHRSDIFSFGVMTYEMLCGVRPFGGETDIDVLHAIQRVPPAPLADHRRDLPPELAVAIEKALEKEPVDRYQSMREMVVDLKRALKARPASSAETAASPIARQSVSPRRRVWLYAAILVAAAAVVVALVPRPRADPATRLETLLVGATSKRLTDFERTEFDAAISADGKLVAFVSDRDGPFDILLTQIGSGHFSNLTNGGSDGLFETDVRTVGFTPDGTNIWVRTHQPDGQITTIARSVFGGTPHLLVPGTHPTWSPDGRTLAYHQSIPGDPIWIADADASNARQVTHDPTGIHNHYLAWNGDGTGVYAARGYLPYQMDIWRLSTDSSGAAPVRLTHHNARVSYPALLDPNTLLYIATAADSAEQTLYALDLPSRVSRRITFGADQYTSVSVGGAPDSRRLAVTVVNPTSEIWTIPITDAPVDATAGSRVPVSTANAHGPRFANGAILFRSSRGGPEGLWKSDQGRATALWRASEGGLTSAPAVSRDGRSIAVVVRNQDRATLRVMDADGSNVRALAPNLDVRDPPTWSRDGQWIAVGADEGSGGRIFKIPIDGGPPVPLVKDQVSRAPQWSPDGSFIVYATPQRGAMFALHAVTPDGKPRAMPDASVTRFEERYHFMPDGRLVVLGQGANYEFWMLDLTTGRQNQLTTFRSTDAIESFDISPDGKTILFDRVRQNADIYTIDLKAPRNR